MASILTSSSLRFSRVPVCVGLAAALPADGGHLPEEVHPADGGHGRTGGGPRMPLLLLRQPVPPALPQLRGHRR